MKLFIKLLGACLAVTTFITWSFVVIGALGVEFEFATMNVFLLTLFGNLGLGWLLMVWYDIVEQEERKRA